MAVALADEMPAKLPAKIVLGVGGSRSLTRIRKDTHGSGEHEQGVFRWILRITGRSVEMGCVLNRARWYSK